MITAVTNATNDLRQWFVTIDWIILETVELVTLKTGNIKSDKAPAELETEAIDEYEPGNDESWTSGENDFVYKPFAVTSTAHVNSADCGDSVIHGRT